MSAENANFHRVVLVIETSAASCSTFSTFRQIVLDRLLYQLSVVNFEAAIVTFSATNGTARSCQSCSTWTNDPETLNEWLDAVPSLMEGIGSVAAYDALAEALSMLEQPSDLTPAPDQSMFREILMLWLSESSVSNTHLVASPDQHGHIQYSGNKFPLILLQPPRTSLVAFIPGQHGSRRSITRIEKEHEALSNNGGESKEPLFTRHRCSYVPELEAFSLKDNSHESVVHNTVCAVRLHAVNDPAFKKQHYAFTQSKQQQQALNAAKGAKIDNAAPAQGTAQSGVAAAGKVVSPAMQSAGKGVGQGGTPATKHNTAKPMQPVAILDRETMIKWHGSVSVCSEIGVPEVAARNVEIGVVDGDPFLAQAMPPNQWPHTLDFIGFLPPNPANAAMCKSVEKHLFCRVHANFNDDAVYNLFTKRSASICFLSWKDSSHCVAIFNKDSRAGHLSGMMMGESTRARCFPRMTKV